MTNSGTIDSDSSLYKCQQHERSLGKRHAIGEPAIGLRSLGIPLAAGSPFFDRGPSTFYCYSDDFVVATQIVRATIKIPRSALVDNL